MSMKSVVFRDGALHRTRRIEAHHTKLRATIRFIDAFTEYIDTLDRDCPFVRRTTTTECKWGAAHLHLDHAADISAATHTFTHGVFYNSGPTTPSLTRSEDRILLHYPGWLLLLSEAQAWNEQHPHHLINTAVEVPIVNTMIDELIVQSGKYAVAPKWVEGVWVLVGHPLSLGPQVNSYSASDQPNASLLLSPQWRQHVFYNKQAQRYQLKGSLARIDKLQGVVIPPGAQIKIDYVEMLHDMNKMQTDRAFMPLPRCPDEQLPSIMATNKLTFDLQRYDAHRDYMALLRRLTPDVMVGIMRFLYLWELASLRRVCVFASYYFRAIPISFFGGHNAERRVHRWGGTELLLGEWPVRDHGPVCVRFHAASLVKLTIMNDTDFHRSTEFHSHSRIPNLKELAMCNMRRRCTISTLCQLTPLLQTFAGLRCGKYVYGHLARLTRAATLHLTNVLLYNVRDVNNAVFVRRLLPLPAGVYRVLLHLRESTLQLDSAMLTRICRCLAHATFSELVCRDDTVITMWRYWPTDAQAPTACLRLHLFCDADVTRWLMPSDRVPASMRVLHSPAFCFKLIAMQQPVSDCIAELFFVKAARQPIVDSNHDNPIILD